MAKRKRRTPRQALNEYRPVEIDDGESTLPANQDESDDQDQDQDQDQDHDQNQEQDQSHPAIEPAVAPQPIYIPEEPIEQRPLRCPRCHCTDLRVVKTIRRPLWVYRTRMCRHCGKTMPTQERAVEPKK